MTSVALEAESSLQPPLGSTRRKIPWSAAAILAATLVVLAALLFGGIAQTRSKQRASLIRSIAVLPLENFSGDPNQEYFADGMTDELITMLAKNPALRVTSRTSVMQYKRVHRPLPEIARELGVDGILEGSVGRSGSRVHVTAQLINALSDTHVWADSYDRDLSDVGTLQGELAQAIARQVGATTSDSNQQTKAIPPAAHDAYLQGRYLWFAGEYVKSQQAFQKAIAAEPNYAAAWSGLADALAVRAVAQLDPPASVMPQALAAARKGIELDDSLGEAHNALAAVLMFNRWQFQDAERESARALELDPKRGESHHLRAYVLTTLNRMDEALQEERKAVELEPLARPGAVGGALIRSHRFDEAIEELRFRTGGQPDNGGALYFLARAYEYKGMEKEAEEVWERLIRLAESHQESEATLRAVLRGGVNARAQAHLDELQKRSVKQYISPLDVAHACAQLRHKEEALRYLEESYRERAPWMVLVQHDPDFDFLHDEPRYRAIVAKMGLPLAY